MEVDNNEKNFQQKNHAWVSKTYWIDIVKKISFQGG